MVELIEQKKEKIIVSLIGGPSSGKSTMLGHILVKQRMIDTRFFKKLEEEAEAKEKPDTKFALLMLKTQIEKEDGHTRDVISRKIETKSRIVTLIDVPGKIKYV